MPAHRSVWSWFATARRGGKLAQSRRHTARPALEALEQRVVPATTINVATFSDTLSLANGISLRSAITQANQGAGDYVINLPAGTYTLSLTGALDNANLTGDLDVNVAGRQLTVQGAGSGTTIIDANHLNDRILHVLAGTVRFQGLTLQNGDARDDTVKQGDALGGGVYLAANVNASFQDVVFKNDWASASAGPDGSVTMASDGTPLGGVNATAGSNARGAGLYAAGSGSVSLVNCTFDSDKAFAGDGGRGYPGPSTRTVLNGGDGAAGGTAQGGGLYLAGETVVMNGVTITGSTVFPGSGGQGGDGGGDSVAAKAGNGGKGGLEGAGQGGGLFFSGGTLNATNLALTGNSIAAEVANGGLGGAGGTNLQSNARDGDGGTGGAGRPGDGAGFYLADGAVTANGLTSSGNFAWGGFGGAGGANGGAGGAGAASRGAGLFMAGGTLDASNYAFHNNFALGGRGGAGGTAHLGFSENRGLATAGTGGHGGDAQGGALYLAGGAATFRDGDFSTAYNQGNNAEAGVGGAGGKGGWGHDSVTGLTSVSRGGKGGDGGNAQGGAILLAGGTLTLDSPDRATLIESNRVWVGYGGPGGPHADNWPTNGHAPGGNGGNGGLNQGGGVYRSGGTFFFGSVLFVGNMALDALGGAGGAGDVASANGTAGKGVSATNPGWFPSALSGTIGNLVWSDTNQNGVADPGEPGLPGVTVQLYSSHNQLLAVTHTQATAVAFLDPGHYFFWTNYAGAVYVQVTPPAGYAFAPANRPGPLSSKINPATGTSAPFTMPVGVDNTHFGIGLISLAPALAAVTPSPRTSAVGGVTVTFNTPVTGVTAAAFTLTRGGAPVDLTGLPITAVSASQYVLNLTRYTAVAGAYVLTLRAAGSPVQDAAGQTPLGDATVAWQTQAASASSNTAPVLDPTAVAPLTPILAADANPVGTSIAAAVGAAITDPDSGALPGVAVLGVGDPALSTGTWQYSVDNGATWTPIGNVSPSSALLLAGADLVRFVPDAAFSGSATLSVQAWDQTKGIAGGTADLTAAGATGGSAAFSTAVGTLSVAVAGRALPAIPEDSTNPSGAPASALVSSAFAAGNPDVAKGVAITALTGTSHGTWQFSLNGGTTWQPMPAVSESAALLVKATNKVRFVPAALFESPVTLTFHAWNATGGTAGSTVDLTGSGATGTGTPFSTATQIALQAITHVNHRPVLDTSASFTFPSVAHNATNPAGTSVQALLGSAVTDPDPGAVRGLAVIGMTGNGTWQYSLDAGQTWHSAGMNRLLRPQDQLRFVPAHGFAGTATLSFKAWDQTTGTAGGTSATTGTAFSTAAATATLTVQA